MGSSREEACSILATMIEDSVGTFVDLVRVRAEYPADPELQASIEGELRQLHTLIVVRDGLCAGREVAAVERNPAPGEHEK